MNGVHDLGGMHGFGPVVREANEPVFHADWERQALRLTLALFARRAFNTDEFRHAIERMVPAEYLATSYYAHWLDGVQRLLIEKGVVTADEIAAAEQRINMEDTATAVASTDGLPEPQGIASRGMGASRHHHGRPARFRKGDRIVARNFNPGGHTRSPRYVRGKEGVIRDDWGVFLLPDSKAHGREVSPQHCYSVEFSARDLWGDDRAAPDVVRIDLWEEYLDTPGAASAGKPLRRAEKVANPRNSKSRPKPVASKTRKAIRRTTPKSSPVMAKTPRAGITTKRGRKPR